LSPDARGLYTIVTEVKTGSAYAKIQGVVNVGDVLVSVIDLILIQYSYKLTSTLLTVQVNNRLVLHDEFDDIITLVNMLKDANFSRKLKFLNTKKCSVSSYVEKMSLQNKSHKDIYGFLRTIEYLEDERRQIESQADHVRQRDLEWVSYLKSIGGLDNLKPSGNFESNRQLKLLVRRGVPSAYRAKVWLQISLASRKRLQYDLTYYNTLKIAAKNLDYKTMDDIDKDVGRTFPEHAYFQDEVGQNCLRHVLQVRIVTFILYYIL